MINPLIKGMNINKSYNYQLCQRLIVIKIADCPYSNHFAKLQFNEKANII